MEQEKHAMPAIVLKFENEPWEDGTGINTSDLIARIIYRVKPGEERRIDYAVWLNGVLRSHYIEVGETHELLLLLRLKNTDNSAVYTVLEDKRILNHQFSDEWAWFRPEDLPTISSAEI